MRAITGTEARIREMGYRCAVQSCREERLGMALKIFTGAKTFLKANITPILEMEWITYL
jgi:hypothetical protein